MEESPAYRLNHEEVIKALEEGISFIEGLEPDEAVPDEYGKLAGGALPRGRQRAKLVELPARTLLVAAGTTPNITYAKEFPDAFPLDERRRFFAPTARCATEDGGWRLEPAPPTDETRLLHRLLARREVHHVLRRQPPRLHRQRRQGDGLRERRLPRDRRGVRRTSGDPAEPAASRADGTPSARRLRGPSSPRASWRCAG